MPFRETQARAERGISVREWVLLLTLPSLGVRGGASHCAIVSPPQIVTNDFKSTCGKSNILLLRA